MLYTELPRGTCSSMRQQPPSVTRATRLSSFPVGVKYWKSRAELGCRIVETGFFSGCRHNQHPSTLSHCALLQPPTHIRSQCDSDSCLADSWEHLLWRKPSFLSTCTVFEAWIPLKPSQSLGRFSRKSILALALWTEPNDGTWKQNIQGSSQVLIRKTIVHF